MKIIVTGGAGFIGSHIVDKLIEKHHQVVVVDNLSTGKKEYINKEAKFYHTDINDNYLDEIFELEKPNYVIHHAAQIDVQTSVHNPVLDAEINILGTLKLVKLCTKHHIKKMVYASSAAVYGDPLYLPVDEKHVVNPISFYGISKHTPEHYIQTYAQLHGLKYTILRYANVYGIRQDPKGEGGVVSIFVDKLLNNISPYIYGDGEQTMDFIYVKDVAAANLAALDKEDNEICNISCNTQTTVNELLRTMNDIMHKDVKPTHQPPRLGDIVHSYLDNTKAKAYLGWAPEYDLQQGLTETIEYYKAD
jgi:UDP-glucose 4-epimerase